MRTLGIGKTSRDAAGVIRKLLFGTPAHPEIGRYLLLMLYGLYPLPAKRAAVPELLLLLFFFVVSG